MKKKKKKKGGGGGTLQCRGGSLRDGLPAALPQDAGGTTDGAKGADTNAGGQYMPGWGPQFSLPSTQTDRQTHTHTHTHTHTRTDTPDTCPKPRTAQTVLRACATPHPWQLQTIRVHRFEQQTESAHTRVNIVHFLVCDFIQHEAKHDAFQLPVPLHCAWKST